MIRHQRAYFQTRSSSGPPEHPAGEGWRDVYVFEIEPGYVHALSAPLLIGKTFSEEQWRAIRPKDVDLDARRAADRVTKAMADLARQGVAFEREPAEQALTLLLCAAAPPPRVRTRARPIDADAPVQAPEGGNVADDGVRPVATGDVHP